MSVEIVNTNNNTDTSRIQCNEISMVLTSLSNETLLNMYNDFKYQIEH
jgi:hypothetical protein